jgi:hypothetical protein
MDRDHPFALRPNPKASGKRARKVEGLIDAQAIHRKHPETFDVPPQRELRKIKPGDFVKVARNKERFWLEVTGFEKRRLHGEVANKLLLNEDLKLGDRIYFQKKNIYSYVPKECATFPDA